MEPVVRSLLRMASVRRSHAYVARRPPPPSRSPGAPPNAKACGSSPGRNPTRRPASPIPQRYSSNTPSYPHAATSNRVVLLTVFVGGVSSPAWSCPRNALALEQPQSGWHGVFRAQRRAGVASNTRSMPLPILPIFDSILARIHQRMELLKGDVANVDARLPDGSVDARRAPIPRNRRCCNLTVPSVLGSRPGCSAVSRQHACVAQSGVSRAGVGRVDGRQLL